MPKLQCTCGEELNDIPHPSPTKFWLTSDVALDDHGFYRKDEDSRLLPQDKMDLKEIWACRKCGAIGIEIEGVFRWFRPVDTTFRITDFK